MSDHMRNELSVKCFCSVHPNEVLRFSTDSKMGASSAMEVNAKILIHPCSVCEKGRSDAAKAISTLLDFQESYKAESKK